MDRQNYMDRALKARDPRFANILGRLGYETRDQVVAEPAEPRKQADAANPQQELATLRQRYKDVVGKRPFNGWDAGTLIEKIEAHQAA
jgi:hypothetical protein